MRAEQVASAGAVLVLAMAGCGGDEDGAGGTGAAPASQPAAKEAASGGGGTAMNEGKPTAPELPPQAQIDLAIKAVLASGVPGLACERYATAAYVRTAFGGRAGCVKSTVPASAASSVAVSEVRLDGDAATARAVPDGGPSSGETIRVELVRVDGAWKVDSLRSNAPVGP